MPDKASKILTVDDDAEMCRFIADVLGDEGFAVTTLDDSWEALKIIRQEEFDVLITDLRMQGLKGLDLLEEAKKLAPLMPVIIITAFGTIESAIQAMKLGAYDYLTKPFKMEELILTVQKALENRSLKQEVVKLKREVETRYQFHQLIGKSPAMQRVYDLITRISETPSNVLITGESGTGKELVAKAIHYNGPTRNGPFVPVNCAAIPETLLESELFGYKKGAFTDAKTDKKGLVFEANEGTLFLDEIVEMPLALQAKLLRVIERHQVRPLGDTNFYPLNVRFISTSNRDIKTMIQQERFREDLYYRLKVIDIEIPPLRERREDIPMLIENFIGRFKKEFNKQVSGISEEALKLLLNHAWPGNVRELENAVQRAVALSRQDRLLPDDLPPSILKDADEDIMEKGRQKQYTIDELEKEYIRRIMIEVGGNKSRAAEILGLDRKTLYRKLQES